MSETNTSRLSNPVLNADTFSKVQTRSTEVMTAAGAVNKTGLSLVILFLAAFWSWNLGMSGSPLAGTISLGVIGGFVVALATASNEAFAPYSTPVYAALEGLALGGISVGIEHSYPGIVSQAVFLTFGILGAMLVAYSSGLVRPSEKFTLGVAVATGGIAILYAASLVSGMFGVAVPLIHSGGFWGIVFSLFVVGVAALNLVLDFELIAAGAERGAPKYMEWYGAFALMVTMVWIYVEVLRLRAILASSDE